MAYQPAGMNSTYTGLAHARNTYYTKKALDQLRIMYRFCDEFKGDDIPKRQGRSIQWFRYDALSSQTVPAVDGVTGTSQTITNDVLGAELSYYSAFISVSSFFKDTHIDPLVEDASDQLGYQAGQTVERLSRDVLDDYNSSVTVTLQGAYATAEDLRAGAAILDGANCPRYDDGDVHVILHPYTMFDIINDPAANGYADIFKYTMGARALKEGTKPRASVSESFGGFKLKTTTNVKVTTGSPNTYRMYMFSKNAVLKASLEGWEPSYINDPLKEPFRINTISGDKFTPFDPTGEIGGMVSYRFTYVAVPSDGPYGAGSDVYRWRTWDCPTKLGL